MSRKFFISPFLVLILGACTHRHSPSAILDSLHTYDRLITKMDADSIAGLYTPDGELGKVAKGRDSIRKFLSTFTNVRVLSNVSSSHSITIRDDSATQKGTYRQEVILPSHDTAHLKGEFTAQWIWMAGKGWRIKKMETTPDRN